MCFMDIVYIIGGDLNNDNNLSLRYSLRSIAKNGIGIDRVIVAGPKLPDWLSDDVIKFEVTQDPYVLKAQRIFSTILAVNDNFKFPEKGFLISMDDHFYVKPTDFNDYPIYNKDYPLRTYRNKLPKVMEDNWVSPDYAQILKNTGDWLRSHNYLDYILTIHRNIHMFPETIEKHRDEINELMKSSIEIEMINVVLDMNLTDKRKLITRVTDHKTASPIRLAKMIENFSCVSTEDFKPDSEIHFILNQEFPDKCKYEK